MWNRYRESKNTKLYEIGSGTKLFITFELKVIRHEEREAQSFYADFSICPPRPPPLPRAAPSRKLLVWSRQTQKVNLLVRRQELKSAFSQIPKILSQRFRCMTSCTPPGLIFHLGFYFDICKWRILPACAWTPVLMFAPI